MATTLELTNIPKGQDYNPALRRKFSVDASLLEGFDIAKAFRPHLVDTETGRHGVGWFIVRFMTQAGCSMPRHTGDLSGEQRQAYIAKSLTVEQVNAAMRGIVPENARYPLQTIKQYLSEKLYHRGMVGKFPMTKEERGDSLQSGLAPNWYYLIESPAKDKASE
jgi:hypothetical protein